MVNNCVASAYFNKDLFDCVLDLKKIIIHLYSSRRKSQWHTQLTATVVKCADRLGSRTAIPRKTQIMYVIIVKSKQPQSFKLASDSHPSHYIPVPSHPSPSHYISLLVIPCIIYYVTNQETLNLEPINYIIWFTILTPAINDSNGVFLDPPYKPMLSRALR